MITQTSTNWIKNRYGIKRYFIVARSSSHVSMGIIWDRDIYGKYNTLDEAKDKNKIALTHTKRWHQVYECKKLGDNFKVIRPEKNKAKA